MTRSSRVVVWAWVLAALTGCADHKIQPGICISMDDYTVNEWYALRPMLDEYDAHVTFYLSHVDSLNEDEWQKLKTLEGDGHEIGYHGAMHVNAEYDIKERSYRSWLDEEIDKGADVMRARGFSPVSFSYPYGATYWFTDWLLLKRFRHLRGVAAQPPGSRLATLNAAFTRYSQSASAASFDDGALDSLQIVEAVERTRQEGSVMMLYGHVPADQPKGKYTFLRSDFERLLRIAHREGLKFYLAKELAP
ncbi:MAG: polysaccharide deacetylase family protein [Cyclobacteriaceae bacterium]|nr:polysaccharide deacetylase family protein [Cyclobacteriaceae bacterium]